jgi:integrase
MTVQQAQEIADLMTGDARDAFIVIRFTAARPSEIFAMRWEYMYFSESGRPNESYYKNPTGKTKSARREIYLFLDSETIIRDRWEEQGKPRQGWVFPNERTKAGRMTTIDKAFRAARKAAGLPKELCLYTARHGMTTDLAGILNPKEVATIVGHSDPSMTMRVYTHPNREQLARRAASLKSLKVSDTISGTKRIQ